MTAEQWCAALAERLTAAILREAPPGLGWWDPAWELVRAPSEALMQELKAIEEGGGSRDRARQLGLDVLAAWRHAAERWRAAGG